MYDYTIHIILYMVVKKFLAFWRLSDHLPVFWPKRMGLWLFVRFTRPGPSLRWTRKPLDMDGWNMAKMWKFLLCEISCFFQGFFQDALCKTIWNIKLTVYLQISMFRKWPVCWSQKKPKQLGVILQATIFHHIFILALHVRNSQTYILHVSYKFEHRPLKGTNALQASNPWKQLQMKEHKT